MVNKIYPDVKLGKNATLFPPVFIGFPCRDKIKKMPSVVIGDNAVIRPFTIIYSGVRIGNNFQCGQGVLIREGNVIGDNVSIGTNTALEPENKIGNNVRIHTGCFLECTTIEDDVVIGPQVVFTDDPHPPCPRYKECVLGAQVKRNAKIGGNSTILPGITIEINSLIGAGSVVTKNIPKDSVACGNPARVIKRAGDLICFKGFYRRPYEWQKNAKSRL